MAIIFPDLSNLTTGTFSVTSHAPLSSVLTYFTPFVPASLQDELSDYLSKVTSDVDYTSGNYNTISCEFYVTSTLGYGFRTIISNNDSVGVVYVRDVVGGSGKIGQFFNRTNVQYFQSQAATYSKSVNVNVASWIGGGEYASGTTSYRVASNINAEYVPDSTDPYDGAGTSEGNEDDGGSGASGGKGTLDITSDTISVPDPTSNLSAVTTGFITLFTPTVSQLQALADYMWSDLFDLDTFKKIFADPMDAILGLSIVPVSVPSSGIQEVTVGNIPTGVSMNKASSQYVQLDCGTLSVQEYVGSYLDYAPYTKAYIYLPYVGIQAIEIDDIMGKTVGVKYNIDVLSGSCACFVTANGTVIATFQGQCSVSIPISANDYTSTISSAIGLISKGVTLAAAAGTGGLAAPIVAATMASASSDVMKSKPNVEKGGSVGSMGGMLGVQKPYIIMTRPRQSVPKFQNIMKGYPSNVYSVLGDLSGFTIVDEIHLAQLHATDAEKNELKELLKGGVIF